ncbi:MAG: hypothetical protein ACK4F9_01345 [Brevinematia bacterium]
MDLYNMDTDITEKLVPSIYRNKVNDIIQTYSPIPKNTYDSLRLLVNSYPNYTDSISKLILDENKLIILSRALGYSVYLRNIFNDNIDLIFDVCNGKINFSLEDLENKANEIFDKFKEDKHTFLKEINKLKRREFLKVVVKEILRESSFEDTCKNLSFLANVILDNILKFNLYNLSKELGEPSSEFCIISLGKLGGLEINYSSDVDIIFVYEKDGKTSKGFDNSEFFDKLARSIIYDTSSNTYGEFLYRVDTRLRPDGEFGNLVRNEQSYYTYYNERAQTWEIQMLIKANFSAGSKELGSRFIKNIKNIVYSIPIGYSEIAEILGIKQKIKGSEYNLKKSTGGIRDIEFIVQLLQLIFGSKDENLRVQNTLLALKKLEETKIISKEIKSNLEYSYTNLRRLENYIQLYNNLQEFSLPINDKQRMIGLFRLLQTENSQIYTNEDKMLLNFVDRIKREVIKIKAYIFEKFLDIKFGEETVFFLYNSDEKEVKDLLTSYGIKEVSRAFSFLESMISSSFKGGVETSIGLRNLLRAISNSPSPDRSLSNIYYILEATQNLPISIQFFTDERNVNFIYNVSLLKDIFINILRKRNWIWDGMMDINAFIDYFDVLLNKLDLNDKNSIETIREVYEVFLTSLAFLRINKFIDANKTKKFFTDLYNKIFMEFSRFVNSKLCVLSLGRWATRKLTFFSDIDLVYIIPYNVHSEEFFEMRDKTIYIHNQLNTIFEIDTRLVEGSHKGSFIVSIESLENSNFEIWQTIAYLKSRALCYDDQVKQHVENIVYEKLKKAIQTLNFKEFNEFIKKVILKFENINDLKKGRGNLLELEFVLDKLFFKHFREFEEFPIAKPLSEMARMVGNVVKIDVPLVDYISFLVEIEDIMKIVEGIDFNDKLFEIAGLPINLTEFQKIKKDIISWSNEILNQE